MAVQRRQEALVVTVCLAILAVAKASPNSLFPETGCWSYWSDWDNPSGVGDFELIRGKEYPNCSHPIGIRCRTVSSKTDATATGENVIIQKNVGCYCRHDQQKPGHHCRLDYEVSFLCPCNDTLLETDSCRDLPKLANGDVNVIFENFTIVEAIAQFSCQDDYKLVGDNQAWCVNWPGYYSGWFPKTPPICKPVCPFPWPKAPSNGHVDVQSDDAKEQWTASYSCKNGFTMHGPQIKKCSRTNDGAISWSQEPTCELDVFPLDAKCSFSSNLEETDNDCVFLNADDNDVSWQQEIYDKSGVLLEVRNISEATLPSDTLCGESEYETVERRSVASDVGYQKFPRSARKANRYKLAISVFYTKTWAIKKATFAVGSFVHPKANNLSKASYMRFRLLMSSQALRYAFQAHADCLPKGNIDRVGSVKDQFKNMMILSKKPMTGDYCLNLKDTISVERCKKFAMQMTLFVQYDLYWEKKGKVTLRFEPGGIGKESHCDGAKILNEE
eukprot:m.138655 g.138655  ORF g.138655 m.138655 type:complete len:501 (+) comp38252_c0_seq2:84-1586(+)